MVEGFTGTGTADHDYLWWLNVKPGQKTRFNKLMIKRRNSAAPESMVAAKGALGRRLFVLPHEKVVVVRLGGPPAINFDVKLWVKLAPILKLKQPAEKQLPKSNGN